MPILAVTDLSDNSRAAIRSAARWAQRVQTRLDVLYCDEASDPNAPWRTVVATPWEEPDTFRQKALQHLESFVEGTLEGLDVGVDVQCRVELDRVDHAVESRLADGDYDYLFVGATGAGTLARTFLGTTAEKLARLSDIPVAIVPHDRELSSVDTMLAPVDMSDCSRGSLELAVELAEAHGASLRVLYALPVPTATLVPYEADIPPANLDDYERQAREALENFVDRVDTGTLDVTVDMTIETPWRAIVKSAERDDADLVVMGTHGRRGLQRWFLGSTATKVLRHIPCPVLTTRHDRPDE